jgi:hypothetical protein
MEVILRVVFVVVEPFWVIKLVNLDKQKSLLEILILHPVYLHPDMIEYFQFTFVIQILAESKQNVTKNVQG